MTGDQHVGSRGNETMLGRMEILLVSPSFNSLVKWDSELVDVSLYVELPYWLLAEPCSLVVDYSDHDFRVDICEEDIEIFAGRFTDSRLTCVYRGPRKAGGWSPSPEIRELMDRDGLAAIERRCKTVLRFHAKALATAFDPIPDTAIPAVKTARDAYFSALCEGYIPVLNEIIQRYRLATYDQFAYELSAWDVPIWYARLESDGVRVVLHPYKEWDVKPIVVGRTKPGPQTADRAVISYVTSDGLQYARSSANTPGEFDLMDSLSLVERGNYTDAIRRVFTAIEAVVEWALRGELIKLHGESITEEKLAASKNDAPGRLRQLKKLRGSNRIPDALADNFEGIRDIRNDIVHRSRRVTHSERDLTLRCVRIGLWLFNKIEEDPTREKIRNGDVPRSMARVSLAVRFPSRITQDGVTVSPFNFDSLSKDQ
jgi:hypothetical protein